MNYDLFSVCFALFAANLGMEGGAYDCVLVDLSFAFIPSLSHLIGLSFAGWRHIFFCNFAESFQLITYHIISSHIHVALNPHFHLSKGPCIT